MIRQLTEPCWYVDDDDEPEPHFDTQAEALADEAERTAATDRAPRPVLATAAPCWAAECDRCERPLGDEDDTPGEVHYGPERALRARLDAAGWRVVTGGWLCCPECASARPALADVERVTVTVRAAGCCWQQVGEVTACPQLAITVLRAGPGGRRLGLALTHRPTGHRLPLGAWTDDVGVLHRVAQLLAGLDWSSSDPAHYATGYPGRLVAAVERALDEHTQATAPPAAAQHPVLSRKGA